MGLRAVIVVVLAFTLVAVEVKEPAQASTASSAHWQPLGLPATELWALAHDPGRPAEVYAGGLSDGSADFFRSVDGGVTWLGSRVNAPEGPMFTLAIDTSTRPHTLWGSGSHGTFTSTDGGATWTRVSPGSAFHLAFDPTRDGMVYSVGGVNNAARSADRGVTWTRLDATAAPRCDYQAVAVAPSDPEIVYLGGGCGLFKSVDRGATWRRLEGGPVGVVAIATYPRDADHLYAGNQSGNPGSGLWETADGGAAWQRLDAGNRVDALLLDPRNPATLFVAARGASTDRWSRDGGAARFPSLRGTAPATDDGAPERMTAT